MQQGWRREVQGDFGWYWDPKGDLEDVTALWMASVELEDPDAGPSSKLSVATKSAIRKHFEDNERNVVARESFVLGLRTNLVKAFEIAEKLGGGYMVVLTDGLVGTRPLARRVPFMGEARFPMGHFNESFADWPSSGIPLPAEANRAEQGRSDEVPAGKSGCSVGIVALTATAWAAIESADLLLG